MEARRRNKNTLQLSLRYDPLCPFLTRACPRILRTSERARHDTKSVQDLTADACMGRPFSPSLVCAAPEESPLPAVHARRVERRGDGSASHLPGSTRGPRHRRRSLRHSRTHFRCVWCHPLSTSQSHECPQRFSRSRGMVMTAQTISRRGTTRTPQFSFGRPMARNVLGSGSESRCSL